MSGAAEFAADQIFFFLRLSKVSGPTCVTSVKGVEIGKIVASGMFVQQTFWISTSVLVVRHWTDEWSGI